MAKLRILLDATQFKSLIRGETIEGSFETRLEALSGKYEIALADIGFITMLQEIGKAMDDAPVETLARSLKDG